MSMLKEEACKILCRREYTSSEMEEVPQMPFTLDHTIIHCPPLSILTYILTSGCRTSLPKRSRTSTGFTWLWITSLLLIGRTCTQQIQMLLLSSSKPHSPHSPCPDSVLTLFCRYSYERGFLLGFVGGDMKYQSHQSQRNSVSGVPYVNNHLRLVFKYSLFAHYSLHGCFHSIWPLDLIDPVPMFEQPK